MLKKEAGLALTVSGKEKQVDRPQPILSNIDVDPYKRRKDPHIANDDIVETVKLIIK